MKRVVSILLAVMIVFSGMSLPVHVRANGGTPQVVTDKYDYVAVEGDIIHYSVKVLNVDEDDEVSYQWYFTVNSLAGESKFPEYKARFGEWVVHWYEAGMFLGGGYDKLYHKPEDTQKSELMYYAQEDMIVDNVDHQWAFICRVTVNGKHYTSQIFTTTVVARDWLTDDVDVTIDENNLRTGNRIGETAVSCETEHLTLNRVEWDKLSMQEWKPVDGTDSFENGSYRARVYLDIEEGRKYKNNPDGYVNGDSTNVFAVHGTGEKQLVLTKTFFLNEKFETGNKYFNAYRSKYIRGNIFKVKKGTELIKKNGKQTKTEALEEGELVVLTKDGISDNCLSVYSSRLDMSGTVDAKSVEFYGYGDGDVVYAQMQNYFVEHPVDVYGGSIYGDVIGTLPYGVVVTAIEYFGYFARINFNGQDGWVFAYYLSKTDKPATDISYMFDTQGYYRVTANSVNIRAKCDTESERIGGLVKGDIIYVTGLNDEFVGFTYGRYRAYVSRSALEKLPDEEIRAIDPVIISEPESVVVDEGNTAEFTISAECAAYANKAYQVGEEIRYAPFTYYWYADIPFEIIEDRGWGVVSFNEDHSVLTISECTGELDDLEVQCQIKGFTFANSTKAYLTVKVNEEAEGEKVINTLNLTGGSSKHSLCIKLPDIDISGEDAEEAELVSEGIDEQGLCHYTLVPHAGVSLSEDLKDHITLELPEFSLESAEMDESGQMKVALKRQLQNPGSSAKGQFLSLNTESLYVTEGKSVSHALLLTNSTGAAASIRVSEGSLPAGLTLASGGISGTPAENSAGSYVVRVSADTAAVTETKTTETPVYKTVKDYVTKTETYTEEKTLCIWKIDARITADGVMIYNAECDKAVELGEVEGLTAQGGDATVTYYDESDVYHSVPCHVTIDPTPYDGREFHAGTITAYEMVTKTREVKVESGSHEELDHYVTETETVEKVPAQHVEALLTIYVASEHVHEYKASESDEALCGEEKTVTYTCSCGDSYEQKLAPAGHKFGSWQNTEAEEGSIRRVRVCAVCGAEECIEAEEPEHQDADMDLICDYCRKDMTSTVLAHLTGYSVEEIEGGKDLSDWSDDMDFAEAGAPKYTEKETDPTKAEESSESTEEETTVGPEEGQKKTIAWWVILLIILGILLLLLLIAAVILYVLRKNKKEEKQAE